MAEQYNQIINKRKCHPTPVSIDPDELLCDIYNRKGQSINVPYVHAGVCKSIKHDGLCTEKVEEPGVAILNSSAERRQKVLEHNLQMELMAPDCLPPIIREKADKSTLASTHFTTAIRIFKHGMVSPITGEEYNVNKSTDANLKIVCRSGKRYRLLSDSITQEECHIVSQWKNADQDKHLGTCNESLAALC